LPSVEYTPIEIETWAHVYTELRKSAEKHAVAPYNHIVQDMERIGLYGTHKIPQLQEVSEYLKCKTGFTLRPVGGLLTPRDFLNGLAFKVKFKTFCITVPVAVQDRIQIVSQSKAAAIIT
jgi:phenylalanine-4-hydroxylase